MLTPITLSGTVSWVPRLVVVWALLLAVSGCSSESSTGSVGVFTEGLKFSLIVNGAWSADPSDPRGRTQGQVRVSVGNNSQIWLGSDTMSDIGDTPDDERYQTIVYFEDLEPGVVTVRVTFQHYEEGTGNQVVTTLEEITAIGDDPIEIEAGKLTDLGTVEVTIPVGSN